MILASVPCSFAASSYNRDKAVAYAKAHWNDGKGLCAEFVSDCLKAGGCTAWNKTVKPLLDELKGWGTLYAVADGTTNSKNWKLNKSACSFDVKPGDIVFFYCRTCAAAGKSGYCHTAIITGFDSKGNILCAQHNGAMNDYATIRGFGHTNAKVDNKKHQGSAISLRIFHMNDDGSATIPVTPPAPVNAVSKWTLSVSGITTNSATVRADITCTPSKLSKVGLELGTSAGNMKSVASWKVGSILTFCSVKCDGSEGPKLSPGTTYYYRFYVLRTDGKYEYSTTGNFTTKSTACTNHTYGGGTVTVNPTCTAAGTIVYKCTKCGASKTEAVKAKGHTAVALPGKAATCTAAGLSEGSKCSVCNTVIKAQTTIPAKGHKAGAWTVTKQPQVGLKGTETQKCTVCSAVLATREIAALSSFLPGDVDKDGKLTATDARLVLRIAVGLERADSETFRIADFNGDGKVTADDARSVLRRAVGLS